MPTYTALLFTNPDGSHSVRVPALPGLRAQGGTRGEALEHARQAASALLTEGARAGRRSPREEWSPARTVRVQNPRRGDTVPYVVCVERAEDGRYRATPVLFPDLQELAASIEEALALLGPRVYQHLVALVAAGKGFPVQDDPQAYALSVPEPGG